jgi:hypothetical protein
MQTNLPPGAKTALEEVAKLARNTLQNLVKILRAAVIRYRPQQASKWIMRFQTG